MAPARSGGAGDRAQPLACGVEGTLLSCGGRPASRLCPEREKGGVTAHASRISGSFSDASAQEPARRPPGNRCWICCQIGAREHYMVARALDSQNALGLLVTDLWSGRTRGAASLPIPRFHTRFHPDLSSAPVVAWNLRTFWFEAISSRRQGWERILARNQWFQRRALVALKSYWKANPKQRAVLFGYSYASRQLLQFARDVGWTTVLGQIDPGVMDEKLMVALYRNLDAAVAEWEDTPPGYWDQWREECRLADHIIVNSEWSKLALISENIAPEKLSVIPLAYDPPADAAHFHRTYPDRFTVDRPLKVLFLGNVSARKGAAIVMDVISKMTGEPIEFRIVGPPQIFVPQHLLQHPQAKWVGPIPRSEVAREYQQADVFLFPTFSDGFGLTQLEAQAWKLPVIVSRCCGEVVRHFWNGYLLPEVTSAEVTAALRICIDQPAVLRNMSQQSSIRPEFSKAALANRLVGLIGV